MSMMLLLSLHCSTRSFNRGITIAMTESLE